MKKKTLSLCALLLGGTLLFHSCIGSFALTNKVLDWNKGIGDKYVNELVFLACNIIPVYPVSLVVDAFVLNSIEFWTERSPLAHKAGEIKTVKGENGEYMVETLENGYTISKDEQTMSFIFNEENSTWSMVTGELNAELLKLNNDGTADLFLPNGQTLNVTTDAQGVLEARQIALGMYFASR